MNTVERQAGYHLNTVERQFPAYHLPEDSRYVGSIVPIRDGVMTALRIE